MKDRLMGVVVFAVVFIGTSNCWAVDGTRINGRAVSANWRYTPEGWSLKYQDADGGWEGAIEVFTIRDGRVAGEKNVVFPREDGLSFCPRFDINGCRIAFYRLGRAASPDRNVVTANGGKTTISVMDFDGQNIVNLCECPAEPLTGSGGNGGIDWPGGEWIYYLMPKSGGRPNEVWKVNATTSENVHVCTFDLGGGRFRRFSLNVFADRMGCQVIDGSWYTSDVQEFPSGCAVTTRSGNCNTTISASGNYQAKFNGNHTELCMSIFPGVTGIRQLPQNTNLANLPFSGVVLYQFQELIPDDTFGNDVEGLTFACNSDKWILQHVGWYGHASETKLGTEQVACNWADMAAIRVSNNGRTDKEPCPGPPDCCGGCGTTYYGNSPGDLWVDGGAENAGKYEDGDGNWHSIPGAPTQYCASQATQACRACPTGPRAASIGLRSNGTGLTVTLPADHQWHVTMFDSRGRVAASRLINGASYSIARETLIAGTYVLDARSSWGEMSRLLFVD